MRPSGPAYRLLYDELAYPFEPALYSLHHKHLGLDADFARSDLIYDQPAIDVWRMVIREQIEPPYFWKLEVGKGSQLFELGDLHAHVIADLDAGLSHLSRNGEIVKLIEEGTEKTLMKYLYKNPVPLKGYALIEYQTAMMRATKQAKRLPELSGYVWE